MRKGIRFSIGLCMLMITAGCSRALPVETQEAVPGVRLTISLPEAEWSGYTEGLTRLYQKTHPEIEDIEWNLVERSMYSDLLRVNVASQKLPDIISAGYGDSLELWKDQLIPLDIRSFREKLPEEYLKGGMLNGELYSVPSVLQARGMIYNSRLLKQAGITEIPYTKTEFEALCRTLEEAEIKPIMNHYKETLLTTTSQLFLFFGEEQEQREKQDQREEQDPIEGQDPVEGWNCLADFLDLTLQYGNRNGLTTGGDTARNYFFIEQYAMLNNEGAWLVPVLRRSAPALEEHITIGPVPFYEEKSRNRLPMEVLTLSVTKNSSCPEEAQEFLSWLSGSEEAREYLEGTMGLLSLSGMKDRDTEKLSPIAARLKEAVLTGEAVYDPSLDVPEELKERNAQIWGRYLTGELNREQAIAEAESLWNN